MQRLTTDEQLEQIWNAAIEAGIAPVRTVDRWGDAFTIFDDWSGVEALHDLIVALVPQDVLEQAPTWAHLPVERRPDLAHHIEWAIGDFGFTDQYSICEHCYVAIDESDMAEDYWRNSTDGSMLCGDCLRKESPFADDYLTDMAAQMEENAHGVDINLAKPFDHGFVCINGESSKYWDVEGDYSDSDHPDYDRGLTYADYKALQRLGKAARLVDDRLQVIYSYLGGSNRIWVRFNPNENVEYSFSKDGLEWDYQDFDAQLTVLGYAIGRMMVKWQGLQDRAR